MEEKKSNNFLINLLLVVIVITIIIMGISIYKLYVSNQELLKSYKTLSMEQSTTPSEIPEPTKLNVAGIYTSGFANLALFPNGTFRYTYSEDAELGTIGNYTINNNEIKLTHWFNTFSDVSLNATKGEKILTINDDNSITDNNFKHSDNKTITLTFSSEVSNDGLGDQLIISHFINEEPDKIQEPNM